MKIQLKSTGIYLLFSFLSFFLCLTSCKKDFSAKNSANGQFNRSTKALYTDGRPVPTVVQTLSGLITGTRSLSNDTLYYLNGPVFVDSLATLNIEEGTFIKGLDKPNTTSGFASYLVVRRGGKIFADGTATEPIVFTSQYSANSRNEGDWGGIVILGQAPVNNVRPKIEGIPSAQIPAALSGKDAIGYGGEIENDNSGRLVNVRIEFAGEVITDGNELNGLTLGGVGSGTTLDHIQVSVGADDAFEFFGGSVNATNLISYFNDDDDFDFDQGYEGSIQFAVAQKDPNTSLYPRSSNPNGIESNNVTSPIITGGTYSTRITNPILSNFSILGDTTTAPSNGTGTVFRAGSSGVFKNSVVGGFYAGANLGAAAGSLVYSNNYLHYFTNNGYPSSGNTIDNTDPNFFLLTAPYNGTAPDWRYITDAINGIFSPLASGWNSGSLTVTHTGGSLSSFTNTGFVGAFGENDGSSATTNRWDSTGWASYTPRTNTY
ncbi:hypothetical protein FA048_12985 [Pedobacter polaris]|uniref:Cell shape-determining protein MreB n=1 Tax=Pedobacter polaris TaxID=2571273 RepID=A0A4U1CKA7_9SPHI|nr:hypothetical protein [Pedobacter polaris]TKC08070.1 hypothetical protein FA048_12985 [Pedobacter polaris]